MFTKETLIDLLNELTGAQESIEKVSVWIQQYRDQAPVIAQTWKTSFIEAPQDKKLTLLFLVNDVLQHSKRKGPQFVDAFGHILPKCMAECRSMENNSQIERMLDIWEQREVFHCHVLNAMKYNLDVIGIEDSHVKLNDLMDAVDLLRGQEKKSSEVLTKLSHRLDTTDFANAFNVTSRKEGDKYAADFDETAHFLDQYCSCLLKQTEARTDMIRKVNSTMLQMDKSDETIKQQDQEYKSQQGLLVRTRKGITSRLMLIEEGMVNFGDDSPDREDIENLTSEEEDVDIEGVETSELLGYQRVIGLRRFVEFCYGIEHNPHFKLVLNRLGICKECCFVEWFCVFYLSVKVIYNKIITATDKDSKGIFKKQKDYLDDVIKHQNSSFQVYVAEKYGPSLPVSATQNSSQRFGPSLPPPNSISDSQKKFGPALPNNSTDKYGPAPGLAHLSNNSPEEGTSFGPPLPIQRYPSTVSTSVYGPSLPGDTAPVPEQCLTSISRLMTLYDTVPATDTTLPTNLQLVFGGKARGYDPREPQEEEDEVEETKPKIVSNSLKIPEPAAQNDKPEKAAPANVLEPILKACMSSFKPPKFSSFPSAVVDAVIKGTSKEYHCSSNTTSAHSSSSGKRSRSSRSPRRHSHDTPRSRSHSKHEMAPLFPATAPHFPPPNNKFPPYQHPSKFPSNCPPNFGQDRFGQPMPNQPFMHNQPRNGPPTNIPPHAMRFGMMGPPQHMNFQPRPF